MILTNEKDVKKWSHNFAVIKKEMELKIRFYTELSEDFKGDPVLEKQCVVYREKIKELQKKLDGHMADMERLFATLDESERLVMIARYVSFIKWDYIELHVFYSRRQAIRIHDGAVTKLVGLAVGEW